MGEMGSIPPRRTLNGLFDAYCRVCWNAVYVLWVGKDDPCGKCIFGHARAEDCPDAMGRAQLQATLAKLRRDGVLPPLSKRTDHA